MSTDLAPVEQQKVEEAAAAVSAVVTQAQAIEVRTPDEASAATEFLSVIKAETGKLETARKFLVEPLKRHAKAIDDQFKAQAEPLKTADKLVREKVLAYQQEQERLRREEQERLDAERREQEAKAEAERKAAVEAAQRAERESREAEERRQAELAEKASARRQEIAAMDQESLEALRLDDNSGEDEHVMVVEEIEARKAAREAQERVAQAEKEAEEARQREIAARAAPATTVAAATPLAAQSGTASTVKRWQVKSIDLDKLPAMYLIPDEKAINTAMREGVKANGQPPEIPGVEFEQVAGLAVRAK
ncbi:MAG: hypothetical protein ACRDK4_05120 [Solirubrobacteraceae bacterium]